MQLKLNNCSILLYNNYNTEIKSQNFKRMKKIQKETCEEQTV